MDLIPIGLAVEALKAGHKVTRAGWHGKGMYLFLQQGHSTNCYRYATGSDGHDDVLPHVFMHTAEGPLVPWLCSQTDLLAEDWIIL